MRRSENIARMCVSALLIAIGIVIPLFSPKIVLPLMSFTLASHVPVLIAMFISPAAALSVAAGTTLGFFISGAFPMVVVVRAASHVVFALFGAWYLKGARGVPSRIVKTQLFSLVIALIHAACEVLAVMGYSLVAGIDIYADGAFFSAVIVTVGAGTAVHSMIDFLITLLIVQALKKQKNLRNLFVA